MYFEKFRNNRFLFFSVMAGAGRLWIYWIKEENSTLHLARHYSLSDSAIMDLSFTSPSSYLAAMYQDKIFEISIKFDHTAI